MKYWVAFKWFLLVNLICIAIPLVPFILNIFIEMGLHIKTGYEPYSIDMYVFKIPIISIPLSIIIAIYKMRRSNEQIKRPSNSKVSSALITGFKSFGISILTLYGILIIIIIAVAMLSSGDNSLIGVWFIFAMPPILVISIIYALFTIKKIKPIIIFLLITVVPVTAYKLNYSSKQNNFYNTVHQLQQGKPTEQQWRDFFIKYENSSFGSKGVHNQMYLVLSLPSVPQDILLKYVNSSDHLIKWNVAKNPALPQKYMYEYMKGDNHLRNNLAKNPNLPQDIIDKLNSDTK